MKLFWSIVAVLAIAATVLLAMPRRGGTASPTPTPEPGPAMPREVKVEGGAAANIPSAPTRTREPDDEPETATDSPSTPVTAAPVHETKPVIVPAPPPPHAAVAPAGPVATKEPTPAPTPELPASLNKLVEEALGNGEMTGPPPATEPAITAAADAPKAADGGAGELGGVGGWGGAKVVMKEDGSMLVDDRFPLKGKGTKADPYQITWDFLISAEETYKPRLGQKELPARFTIVKGKWVKITGYVAFPIMAQEADEMLAMLNQWDGCCIGVPPTPYDAVEVKLHEPAEKEDRFAVYGSVTGKLGIEPYLVKDWLIGLYTMSDATLKAER